MTFSFSWGGKHTDYHPENVDHTPGNGGDLEDRVVVALKHAVASVLRSLGPDAEPREVNVSASGTAPEGDDPAGTQATISVYVPNAVTPAVPSATDVPTPSSAPEPPEAPVAPSGDGTDAGGAVSPGVPPDSTPADPAGDPAPDPAGPIDSSSSATTPAEPDSAPQE